MVSLVVCSIRTREKGLKEEVHEIMTLSRKLGAMEYLDPILIHEAGHFWEEEGDLMV